MKTFLAIAAMSENRVIGSAGKIPWRLPEDFRFFRKMTIGNVIVMGRKTFQGLGHALPDRHTVVLSRKYNKPNKFFTQPDLFKSGTWNFASELEKVDLSLKKYAPDFRDRDVFICGGAQIYALALPFCTDLFLTRVKREVEGDTFFPEFEDRFELVTEILDNAEFKILHYQNLNSPL